ncbi:alginate export family protein [Neorhodopirellula lusitana]|uniref:alginate export family protein n=1 Tax=Neorhodopirellula lusitana TaxID=445327 RepID=UPI00385057FC
MPSTPAFKRFRLHIGLVIALRLLATHGPSALQASDPVVASKAYAQSNLENDFRYLDEADVEKSFLGESLKRLQPTDQLTIDLGGQYRMRFHNENNIRGQRLAGRSDDFLLHRTRVFADMHWGDNLRLFAEAIDATSDGNEFTPSVTEVNRFDAQNLALDARLMSDDEGYEWWVRGGRQELYLGSQRLVSNRPWRNTPLNHDGVRTWVESDDTRVDAFWVQTLNASQHIPEDHNFDSPDTSKHFFGVFMKHEVKDRLHEFYYYGLIDEDPVALNFAGDAGNFDIHTIGGRTKRSYDDTHVEIEGGYQFGNYADLTQSAGFFTGGIGRTLAKSGFPTAVWLYYDWASGDDDLNDGTHGTFHPLNPRGHYYLGAADLTGRQNLHDLNLQVSTKLTDKLQFNAALHNYWLANRRDAVYSIGGSPTYQDPSGSASRQLANELDLQLRWTISPRTQFIGGYTYLWAGDYFDSPVIQGGPAGIAPNGATGGEGEFTYVQFSLRF